MAEVVVGIRDLKTRLSEYMRQLKEGKTIVITERGRPIGRIVPEPQSDAERLQYLLDTGAIFWNGEELPDFEPVAINKSNILLSDIVSQLRE